MALKFQKVTVDKITRETADSITIHFRNPDPGLFQYIPGQYLTLKTEVNGKNYNRAYSLCSSPFEDEHLAVTVKVTPGGLVSTHLNKNLKEGDSMEVLPPLGSFCARIDPTAKRHYVLIGGGSGITPLMSILRSALAREPQSKVSLLYTNRNQDNTIFYQKLEEIKKYHGERLEVIHHFTRPTEAQHDRINRHKIKELLSSKLFEQGLPREYYLCGPSGLMQEAGYALRDMAVPAAQVHEEHFAAPLTHAMEEPSKPQTESNEIIAREIKVIYDGEERTFTVKPTESILEAALDHDMDPPYACMIGSCCTCKAKLVSGRVVMDDREGLTDAEIAEGYVLTCQSHPVSEGVVVNYDEV